MNPSELFIDPAKLCINTNVAMPNSLKISKNFLSQPPSFTSSVTNNSSIISDQQYKLIQTELNEVAKNLTSTKINFQKKTGNLNEQLEAFLKHDQAVSILSESTKIKKADHPAPKIIQSPQITEIHAPKP